jgi:hypothetical protein
LIFSTISTTKLNATEEVHSLNFLKPSSPSGHVGALVGRMYPYVAEASSDRFTIPKIIEHLDFDKLLVC